MPVDSPTVPKAETASNISARKRGSAAAKGVPCVSVTTRSPIARETRAQARRVRRSARSITAWGIVRWKTAGPAATAPARDHERDQQPEGRGLDPAAGGARRRADEHQEDREEQRVRRELAVVDGVEARGARGDRLEPRREQALRRGAGRAGRCPTRAGGTRSCRRRAAPRSPRSARRVWRVRSGARPPAQPSPGPVPQLHVDEEAEAAHHDERGDHEVDEEVAAVADEAVGEEPEAGVAEGGDRVEDALPDGLARPGTASRKRSQRRSAPAASTARVKVST